MREYVNLDETSLYLLCISYREVISADYLSRFSIISPSYITGVYIKITVFIKLFRYYNYLLTLPSCLE